MAEVAKANDVLFVDLFTVSQRLYAEAAKQGHSLTFNTFLLTEAGNGALAPEIFKALFNEPAPKGHFEKLRAAVLDKCNEWHARYRTVDGYNEYGGRSKLIIQRDGNERPVIANYIVTHDAIETRDVNNETC